MPLYFIDSISGFFSRMAASIGSGLGEIYANNASEINAVFGVALVFTVVIALMTDITS